MSLNEIRINKIEQLNFVAQTENEKNTVIQAAKEICDAESDALACKLADKYFKKLIAPKLTNMVDVIAILLKGGHIVEFTPALNNGRENAYLVFIPVPDFPNKKTLVGHLTKKRFNELYDKGIISERKHLRHTDYRGRNYLFYYIAEDIIRRFRGELEE